MSETLRPRSMADVDGILKLPGREMLDRTLDLATEFASEDVQDEVLALYTEFNILQGDLPHERLQRRTRKLLEEVVSENQSESEAAIAERAALREFLESQKGKAIEARTVFKCEGLGFGYPGGRFRLQGVDLELREGEVTGVFGGNANGKTTLFKLVVGLIRAGEGTMSYPALDGSDDAINWRKVKGEIAYVPQELPPLFGTMEENLRFAAASHGITGKENDVAVNYFATRLSLDRFMGCRWEELSGGFKLRFSLARALITKPKLLALDEPLANLDFISQLTVLRDIRNLASSYSDPLAVLITSQHLHEIEAVADQILFLEHGKVVYYGDPDGVAGQSECSIFEIGTKASRQELAEALEKLSVRSIHHNGLCHVVQADKDVDAADIWRALARSRLETDYFRNISNSVKQLFEDGPNADPFGR